MNDPGLTDAPVQVLVVDDDDATRNVISRFLIRRGCEVITAASGEAALEQLRSATPDIMLLDVTMPGMSGVDVLEVLPETLDADATPVVVMLSGKADAATAAACMQRGAMEYLTKPFDFSDVEDALKRALKQRAARLQDREVSAWLTKEVTHSQAELERAHLELKQLTVATFDGLISALEAKSPYLAGHSARVSATAASIAYELGLSDDEVDQVRVAGRLHDLGMIGIQDRVVDKRGKLTEEDFAHIREHVMIGARMIRPFVHLAPIVGMVRAHHENWDGSGYPQGLAGEDIPFGGRILRAAEVYDAVTTRRPYQSVKTPEEAVVQMRGMVESVLDPKVMDALESVVEQRHALVFLDEE